MKTLIQFEYWEAVRLKSLIADGMEILKIQGRTQRGIDGYTNSDLINFINTLEYIQDKPKYVAPLIKIAEPK